jgi:hypothetical protein
MNDVLMIKPQKYSPSAYYSQKKHRNAPALRFCGAAYLSESFDG